MSERRIEQLREGFAAMNRGDFAAASKGFHPRVVWVDPPELIGGGTHRGVDTVVRFWESYGEAFGEWSMDLVDVQPHEETAALVEVRIRHRGRESGIPLDFTIFQVWEWDDADRVTSVTGYLRRADVPR